MVQPTDNSCNKCGVYCNRRVWPQHNFWLVHARNLCEEKAGMCLRAFRTRMIFTDRIKGKGIPGRGDQHHRR